VKRETVILKAAAIAALCLAQGIWAQIWNGTVDSEWYWDNSSQTEFTITTAEQLAGLAQLVNGGNNFSGKTIKLGANIMLNDTVNWKNWSKAKPINTWTPISSYTDKNNNRPFSGTFDGNNYVISGVYLNNDSDYQGLFSYVDSNVTIKNLGVIASFIKGGGGGSLVGYNGGGTIVHCYAVGNVEGRHGYSAGGLVGFNEGGIITDSYSKGNVAGYNSGGLVGKNEGGTITNCYATGNVEGNDSAGGLVGSNGSVNGDGLFIRRTIISGTIADSYATGNVKGIYSAGGLIGRNYGTITGCHATGGISATGSGISNGIAGGLVGYNEGGTIVHCYAMGNVSGGTTGGLVGENESKGTIENCYATGNVSGTGTSGGFVGWNSFSTITDCHATGDVSGRTVGGLAGGNEGTITNCYAIGNAKGTESGGLVGSNSGLIMNCYATGNVEGKNFAGGLVGENESKGTIENCYATGNASGTNGGNIGGLVGGNKILLGSKKQKGSSIINCYAIGNVSGTGASVGGLVGENEVHFINTRRRGGFNEDSESEESNVSSKITNSYYDRQASGQSDIVKGEPKSMAQMKQQETFVNWDFDKIWRINADKNKGYPYLQFSESVTQPQENIK